MRTFIADIIPQLQVYSKRLDNLTLLTNQQWVLVDEHMNSKTVYIFRSNSELLISRNGEVEKAKWEYLGNNSLLLDLKDKSYLFRHGFFDENILALKLDSKAEYAFFLNENKGQTDINSISGVVEFLNSKYLRSKTQAKPEPRIETKQVRRLTATTNQNLVIKKEKPVKSRKEVLETNIRDLRNQLRLSKIIITFLLIVFILIASLCFKATIFLVADFPMLGLIALVLYRTRYLKKLLKKSESDLKNLHTEDEGLQAKIIEVNNNDK